MPVVVLSGLTELQRRQLMLADNRIALNAGFPFLGSGTTLIAAETTGRVCLAMELEPRYVDVAVRRWQAFTGMKVSLLGDGRSFEVIAAERLPDLQSINPSPVQPIENRGQE